MMVEFKFNAHTAQTPTLARLFSVFFCHYFSILMAILVFLNMFLTGVSAAGGTWSKKVHLKKTFFFFYLPVYLALS